MSYELERFETQKGPWERALFGGFYTAFYRVSLGDSTGFLWRSQGLYEFLGAFDPAQNPRQQDTYDMDA